MILLKPFRQVNEYDVVNLFGMNTNTGNEGDFVKVVSSGYVSDDIHRTINLTSEAHIVSQRRVLKPEVGYATSGNDKGDVLGVLLKNIRATDYLGRDLLYDDTRKTEANAVISGEAVPVATRGLFLVSGIEGTPKRGSGIAVSNSVNGGWRAYNPDVETTVKTLGVILGDPDADGYALVKIEC